MIEIQIDYRGELHCDAVHGPSTALVSTDAPVDNNGKGQAFSPTDLVATALASCMITVMGIKAKDKGLDIDGTSAEINKVMASGPRRIERVEITLTFPPAAKNFGEKDKKFLEKTALTCPVALSLSENTEQKVEFVWP